jgi:hypothetical protein
MSFLEAVLQRTKRIERLLEENYQAVGRGLHDKATSVEHQLDASAVKQLRFIASVRNKLMHEDGYDYDPNDQGRFLEVCDKNIQYLLNCPPVIQASKSLPTSHYKTNITKPKAGPVKKFLMIIGGFWLFGLILVIAPEVVKYFARQSQIQAERPSNNKSQIVKVDGKILDSYAGQYDCKSYKMTVSRTSNSLKTSSSMATGVLSAISETEFAAENYSNDFRGRIKFAKNRKGKVFNLIIVNTNGSQEQCNKIK